MIVLVRTLLLVAIVWTGVTRSIPVPPDSYGFKIYTWDDMARVTSLKYVQIETDGSFVVNFGKTVGEPVDCGGLKTREDIACLQWPGKEESTRSRIHIKKRSNPKNYEMYTIRVTQGNNDTTLSVCFSHKDEMLYGGNVGNNYPSNYIVKEEAPFVTGEGLDSTSTKWIGWVAEKRWLTSGGRGIHVKPGSPLFVTQNATDLCLILMNKAPYPKNSPMQLEYDLCVTNNVKEAWICQNPNFAKIPLPSGVEYVLREPIWSTWVAYKKDISQPIVMEFVKNIKKHGLRIGVLEVDEKWETCFGSQKFDPKTFPDPKAMIKYIQSLGIKVTFWRHPFINKDCDEFKELSEHLFKYRNGTVGTSAWWEGEAGLFNFMQKETFNFFTKRLNKFKNDYNIDGFKFDAGEAYYIPGLFETTPLIDPNQYTSRYLKLAEGFGPNSEVRVGADSVSLKVLQRLQDTQSDWSLDNFGLKSVIPSTLQLSILGYHTIMPDMVGGNSYGPPPSKELFIRWVELTTFLPIMQFSFRPWSFDKETIDITRRYIDLHYEYSDRMLKIHNDLDAPPLINPVWWLDPENLEAQQIMDEFLVGDEILVAPIVEEGATSRSIYVPSGTWKDANTGQVIKGPTKISKYPASLDTLPYFLRQV